MKKSAALILVCLFFFTLSGCTGTVKTDSRYLFAMDTIMELTASGPGREDGLDQAAGIIKDLETLLSVTDEKSAVHALNDTGRLDEAPDDLAALLDLALSLGERTGGALDVTVYPVVKAWGFTGDAYQVPDQEELDALLANVDWSAVAWDGETVSLPQGVQLDFGSIAKGYAGSKAAQALRDAGVTSALLNLGGNVQTVGSKPDGSSWHVAVKDPLDPESERYLGLATLLDDQAAVTSGGYERYFEADGQTYWHIINPATGRPAHSGLVSVTVVGDDGALCDGLSTALFILGREGALDYWRTWGGFEAVLVEEDGTVTVTAGLAGRFELTGDGYTLTIAE